MEENQLSRRQGAALLWAGTLAPAVELLPGITLAWGSKGVWLAPLVALPLVLAGTWMLGRGTGRTDLARRLRTGLGPLGVPVLLLYMTWGVVLLAIRLRLWAGRLLAAGHRDGGLWFFLIVSAAMVLWLGTGRLTAFARAGQLFLTILLTAAGAVLLLSLAQVRPERVLPLWVEDGWPVLGSGLSAAGVLSWGVYGAFLIGGKADERRGGWFVPSAVGCFLLALSQWVILGCLGPVLAGTLENPFLALAQGVGIEGAFQRVESVIAALWSLADLTMAGVLVFALRAMAAALGWRERRTAIGAILLAAVLALSFLGERRAMEWNRTIFPWLGLAMAVLLVLLHTVVRERAKE